MFSIIHKEASYVILEKEGLKIRIQAVYDNIIRISATKNSEFTDDNRDAILVHDAFGCFESDEDDNELVMTSDCIRIHISKASGALSFFSPDGTLLFKEPGCGGKHLSEKKLYKTRFKDDADIVTDLTADGIRTDNTNYETYLAGNAYEARLDFEFDDDECIWGLGCHEEGYGNLRGRTRTLYQENLKTSLPSFVSSKGYGFLLNAGCLMNFADNEDGSYIWADIVDELDYYILIPDTVNKNDWQNGLTFLNKYDGVIAAYRKLTGDAPLLPRWAFGYIQSKERYCTAQEMIDVVKEYRRRQVPLDCIILDWMSWEDGFWGQKTFDRSRFEDPGLLTETLHALGAKMMISIWPNMSGGCPNQEEMKNNRFLLGDGATYDSFNKKARSLYWKQAEEGLFKYGIDGWWCDCTEPFGDDWQGIIKPQPFERVLLNTQNAKKYLDPRHILEFSFYHSMGIYDGMRSSDSKKRVINLTRSSFTGQCRFGTVTWSGDVSASWETLKRQIAEGLHFSASGDPYWTLDIGGFFVKNDNKQWFWNGEYDRGCEDTAYRELYVRWLQYATFLPMMRSHGTDTPREIWQFGEKGTIFYDTIEKYIRLRSSLVPYIYSLSAMVTFASYSFIRAVVFDYPHDKDAMNVSTQYMFGPAFMVCPVTFPVYGSKEKKMSVYLPNDTLWYDFHSGKIQEQNGHITVDVPIDKMPVYVKAGSIIPMIEPRQYVSENDNPDIYLHIYDGADGMFRYYEDKGDGYDYENGDYSYVDYEWNNSLGELTIHSRKGSYGGINDNVVCNVVWHFRDGKICQKVCYKGDKLVIRPEKQ